MLTPTFHFNMVEGYIQTMDKHAKKLVDFLGQWTETRKIVDVFPIIKRTALDIICGKDWKLREEGEKCF